MGIPGLLSRLQSYATPLEFHRFAQGHSDASPGRPPPAAKRNVIVDGPAFAHFIFYEEILASGHPNSFVSTLSYRQIGEAARRWLRRLTAYDAQMYVFHGLRPVFHSKVRWDTGCFMSPILIPELSETPQP